MAQNQTEPQPDRVRPPWVPGVLLGVAPPAALSAYVLWASLVQDRTDLARLVFPALALIILQLALAVGLLVSAMSRKTGWGMLAGVAVGCLLLVLTFTFGVR